MHRRKIWPNTLLGLALTLPVTAAASPGQPHDHTPAVTAEAGAAPADPLAHSITAHLPAPPKMTGIGSSSLTVTTKSAEAQAFFDQGLRLLHCFWDFEAYRAFEEASRQDPELAMAYWGMAQALGGGSEYEPRIKALRAKANDLAKPITDHERLYIDGSFAASQVEDYEAARALRIRGLEAIVDRHPDDVDAKLFLALELMSGYDGDSRPEEGTVYSQAILAGLLLTHPDHAAVHHYWIHAVEEARPERAVASADRLLELAPESGHMVHMPGHIYSKIGNYARAREIFLASKQVDEAYMARAGVTAVDNWNYVHNLFYLVSDASESGRYAEGLAWARELQAIPVDPNRPHAGGNHNIFHQGRVPLVQFLLRYGQWQEGAVAAREVLRDFELHDDSSRFYLEGLAEFALGMASLPASPAQARDHWAQLDARILRLGRLEEESDDHLAAYRGHELTLHSSELEGLIRMAEGDTEAALALLATTAEEQWREMERADPARYSKPTHEILGDAYLAAGRYADARTAFAKALEARPQSGSALYGIASAYRLEGNGDLARSAFETFLTAWGGADPDRPEVVAARQALAAGN